MTDAPGPGATPTFATSPQEAAQLGSACCRKGTCCRMGSGIVRDEELPAIASAVGVSVEELKHDFLERHSRFGTTHWRFRMRTNGKPYGPCVFFDEGATACTIHDVKPLYCRVGICDHNGAGLMQWYNARYFLNLDDPNSIREYAIATKGGTIPGASVKELVAPQLLADIIAHKDLRKAPPRPAGPKRAPVFKSTTPRAPGSEGSSWTKSSASI
jgi:Fe-S-cluster containining protein